MTAQVTTQSRRHRAVMTAQVTVTAQWWRHKSRRQSRRQSRRLLRRLLRHQSRVPVTGRSHGASHWCAVTSWVGWDQTPMPTAHASSQSRHPPSCSSPSPFSPCPGSRVVGQMQRWVKCAVRATWIKRQVGGLDLPVKRLPGHGLIQRVTDTAYGAPPPRQCAEYTLVAWVRDSETAKVGGWPTWL